MSDRKMMSQGAGQVGVSHARERIHEWTEWCTRFGCRPVAPETRRLIRAGSRGRLHTDRDCARCESDIELYGESYFNTLTKEHYDVFAVARVLGPSS